MTEFIPSRIDVPVTLKHERPKQWVAGIAAVTQPDRVHWANGSQREYDQPLRGTIEREIPPLSSSAN